MLKYRCLITAVHEIVADPHRKASDLEPALMRLAVVPCRIVEPRAVGNGSTPRVKRWSRPAYYDGPSGGVRRRDGTYAGHGIWGNRRYVTVYA